MSLDVDALQARLRAFAAERQWQPFHTPKNLAMALMVEAAELTEIFQWMTPEQSLAVRDDPALTEPIADEVAECDGERAAQEGAFGGMPVARILHPAPAARALREDGVIDPGEADQRRVDGRRTPGCGLLSQ